MKYVQKVVSASSENVKQELWPQFGIEPDPSNVDDNGKPKGSVRQPNGSLKVQTVNLETLQLKDFENLQEALADPDVGGETGLLKIFNVQFKTTMMNRTRQKYTGEVSDSEIEGRAIRLMFQDPQWQAAASQAAADPTGQQFDALKQKAMEAIRQSDQQAAMQRAQAAAAAQPQAPVAPTPPQQ